jgi:pyruvate,orthophosphate dikinase
MGGRPVTVRLIDPPLHEFLPSLDELLVDVTKLECAGKQQSEEYKDKRRMLAKVQDLHEANPRLGLRGVRLSIYFPGIVKMQVAAIIGAACEVKKSGVDVHPEIMIPLVGLITELTHIKEQLERVAKETMAAEGVQVDYKFGTMIEIPRAALTADEIAKEAEFFSFGTNDLTQMTFGFSRDDAGKFLPSYYSKNIFEQDPFEKIDQIGVGKLVDMACKLGRSVRPDIHLGICGEHGGEPTSVEFCHRTGLDYVSCSPFRVPIARLAAAHAQIKNPRPTGK